LVADEEKAKQAFENQMLGMIQTNHINILCDGCELLLTSETGRFVCKTCQDVDLCRDCHGSVLVGTLALPNCLDHHFLEVFS
jgi:hypothetical protein